MDELYVIVNTPNQRAARIKGRLLNTYRAQDYLGCPSLVHKGKNPLYSDVCRGCDYLLSPEFLRGRHIEDY